MQLLLVSFSACTPVAGIVRLTPTLPFLHVRPCGNCACSARATGAVSSATHASRKHAHAYPVLRYPLRKIIVPAGARPYSDPTRRPGLRGCGSTTRRSSVRSIHQPDASTRARYSAPCRWCLVVPPLRIFVAAGLFCDSGNPCTLRRLLHVRKCWRRIFSAYVLRMQSRT